MNFRRRPLWQVAKCSPELELHLQNFPSCYASIESTCCWATTQKCPEYRHPIHSIIGWSLMVDETHFFLWDRKYSLSFFRMKGLGADWFCHGYSITKKNPWIGSWKQDLAFTWNDWLIPYTSWLVSSYNFQTVTNLWHLISATNHQTALHSGSPNSLPTSTVSTRHNLDWFLNVRMAANLENMAWSLNVSAQMLFREGSL